MDLNELDLDLQWIIFQICSDLNYLISIRNLLSRKYI